MSILNCSATATILDFGPTRMGTMILAAAASAAPRSDDSSQGCTTIVVAAGTSCALAISRSYFACAGRVLSAVREIAIIELHCLDTTPGRRPLGGDARCLRRALDIHEPRHTL